MNVVFRLAYGLAVAIFYILVVVFGSRTFYSEPGYPDYPRGGPPGMERLYCDQRDCYYNDVPITPEQEGRFTAAQRQYLEDQREYQRDLRNFEDDRDDYFRNVFIIAGVLGAIGIAAGVFLYRQIEAIPLGLVLGGTGSVLYGWAESSRGDNDITAEYAFIVAALGLAVMLFGGYWVFGREGKKEPTG